MRINTNVSAMSAANNLSKVQSAVSSSMEKLSSGFRINRAADDAAGLGIANTLRADGRALSQASRNADQTNSLLQVAEGGTSTIETILERMKELATQSGSDTVDAAGRASINAEFTALRSEIDRTVNTTKFQGNSLLDGTFGTTAAQLTSADVTFTGGNASTAAAGAYTIAVSNSGIATLNRPAGSVPPTYSVDLNNPAGAVSYAGGKASITFGSGNAAITIAATASGASDIAGIQKSLDAHGFTITAAVATTASTGTTSVAGASAVVIPSSVASGTLHFAVTDATATPASGLTASSYISATSVNQTQAAGAYTLHVVSTDASVTGGNLGAATGVGSLAVANNQAAGVYTIAVSDQNAAVAAGSQLDSTFLGAAGTPVAVTSSTIAGSYTVKEKQGDATKLQIFRGTTQVGSDVDITAYDGSADLAVNTGGISFTVKGGTYISKNAFDTAISGGKTFSVTGSAALTISKGGVQQGSAVDLSAYDGTADVSVNQGGISFTIDHTADATAAAIKTALNTKTATVTGETRTLTLTDPLSATVGSAQDFSSFDGTNNISFSQGGVSFTIDKSITKSNIVANLDGKVMTVQAAKIDVKDAGSATVATQNLTGYSAGADVAFSNNGYGITFAGGNAATNNYTNLKATLNNIASTITVTHVAAAAASAASITGNGSATAAASFLVDSSGAYKTNDMIQLGALNLTVSTLGLTTSDLSTADGARNALSTIDSALGTVSTALGTIGANQNRISYAQDNLKAKISNFSAAESVIRDVDMADEMTKFSKNNILAQAGTAMLAQANQAGQSVLKLLQG